MHQRTELGLDLRTVPYVARVPRFVWGLLARAAMRWAGAAIGGDVQGAARYEMRCAYALGYIRACWASRRDEGPAPLVVGPESASL
jgi:hypothetical protein